MAQQFKKTDNAGFCIMYQGCVWKKKSCFFFSQKAFAEVGPYWGFLHYGLAFGYEGYVL